MLKLSKVIAVMAVALASQSVGAQSITFYFGGEIQTHSSALEALIPISNGMAYSGSYTFSAVATDSTPCCAHVGVYDFVSYSVTIGSALTFASTSSGLTLFNEPAGGNSSDIYNANAEGLSNGSIRTIAALHVLDNDGSLFTSDALPTTPAFFSNASVTNFHMLLLPTPGITLDIGGSVSYLSLTDPTVAAPIPEPETYAMLLAGLGLLGFEARRRRKLQRAT